MDLLNLEQQRLALEDNLQQLRQSLKHWQTWEAEYEGLKEEFLDVNGDLTSSQLENIAQNHEGDLLKNEEVRELTGLDLDTLPRSANEITELIERKQNYAQKKIEKLQKQFFEAEAKSEELAFASRSSSEAGLPLTEIHEELDEEGNVISSHLTQPEEVTAKVVESLRKAGLSEDDLKKTPGLKPKVEDLKPAITNASPSITASGVSFDKRAHSDPSMASPSSDASNDELERPSIRKKSVSFSADTKVAQERPRPEFQDGKKVSFAEKVAVMPAAPPPDNRSVSFSTKIEEIPPLGPISPDMQPQNQEKVQEVKALLKPSEATSESDAEVGADEQAIADDVVMPDDESPEDARLRREMLDYHLNEVGNVVAQIDLDEAKMDLDSNADEEDDNNSYYTSSEYIDDEDTPYTTGLSESEDSEDEHGRSKRRQISPEYRKQMEELQQKLIDNLGPAPKDEDIEDVNPDVEAKDVRRLVIRDKRNSDSSVSSDNSEKKGAKKRVSFAESLDVAEPGSPPLKAQKLQESDENAAPVAESVVERTTATSHSLPESMTNDQPSRFMKARAAPITNTDNGASTPAASDVDMDDTAAITDQSSFGPPGVTIASTLIERPTSAPKPASSAPSANDLDPIAQRRELAAEYYRRRNDMVRQQGGFKSNDDEEDMQGELMEERDGKVKKVSRFKAARIKS